MTSEGSPAAEEALTPAPIGPAPAVTSGAAAPIKSAEVVSAAQPLLAIRRQDAWQSEAMLARLVAHEALAWQELFDQYYRKMYSFAYLRTGDASAAEDIAAGVFEAAAKGIRAYRHTGAPFAAWLYRIARNLTADHLERRRRQPQVDLDDVELEAPAWAAGLEDKHDLAQAIGRLTREQQEVIVLRFVHDCSLEETARSMNKSVGAVKVLQHRAIGALRRQLLGAERRA